VKQLKEKMRKDLEKEREQHRRQLQNTTVRFPTHTTDVYHSTSIQPSAYLLSSESLLTKILILGGSCRKNMTSTGGCSYSFVYS